MGKHLVLAALLAASCAAEPTDSTEVRICQTCGAGDGGGGPTYQQSIDWMNYYQAHYYAGSQRVTGGCDSVEVGGSTAYSCYVAFDFNGHRYTASCTVWDNTESDSAVGHNGCDLVRNDG